MVEEVDRQNALIARTSGGIGVQVDGARKVLGSFDAATLENEARLETALFVAGRRWGDLELAYGFG